MFSVNIIHYKADCKFKLRGLPFYNYDLKTAGCLSKHDLAEIPHYIYLFLKLKVRVMDLDLRACEGSTLPQDKCSGNAEMDVQSVTIYSSPNPPHFSSVFTTT